MRLEKKTKADSAFADYLGGMKYKDIAEKYGKQDTDGPEIKKKVCTQKRKKCAHKKNRKILYLIKEKMTK